MFKWLFATPPKVGSVWEFREFNPFDSFRVTVLEIKRGWVKYSFGLITNTRSIRAFRTLYREVLPEEEL